MVAYPAREVRPTPDLEARARDLVTAAPWAASTWDRIAEGQIFPGIESWLPWLADEHSLLDVVPESATTVLVAPARALDRSRDLVKEEAELAAAMEGLREARHEAEELRAVLAAGLSARDRWDARARAFALAADAD